MLKGDAVTGRKLPVMTGKFLPVRTERKSAGHTGMTGKSTSSDRQDPAGQTGRNLPPNPSIEPLEEPQ